MSAYRIHPLQTARTARPMTTMTYLRNYGREVEIFYGAFLIEGEGRRVLVDAGCDAKSYAAGQMPPIEDVATLDLNLRNFGLGAMDIDAVIVTHLHFDHAAFLHRFSHCPVFVQERELRSALNPNPYFRFLYVPAFFRGIRFEMIDGDMQLFPGISVALVPGHSAGAQAVLVKTSDGTTAVSGFCCAAENFDRENPAIPGIHEDVREAVKSMDKLMEIADIIFPNHSATPVRIKR
jgi:N-acyl homoserine lactone hydrolase